MAACRPTKQSMACQQRRVPSSARGREPRLGLLQKGIRDWRRHASNGRPGQPPFDRLTPQCGLRGRNGILHLLGYDHDKPEMERQMRTREAETLDYIGVD